MLIPESNSSPLKIAVGWDPLLPFDLLGSKFGLFSKAFAVSFRDGIYQKKVYYMLHVCIQPMLGWDPNKFQIQPLIGI